MLYGSESSFIRLATDAVLTRVFGANVDRKRRAIFEVNVNGTRTECEYMSSCIHVEIDIERIKGSDKQMISEFVSNHLASTRAINSEIGKHIIVMHGVEYMSAIAGFALRKILECQRNNTLFILTCSKVSKVCEAILSRCTMIRCNIPREAVFDALDHMMSKLDIDEFKIHENSSFITSLVTQTTTDGVSSLVLKFMEKLMATEALDKAFEEIRAFSHLTITLNVSLAHLAREVMHFLMTTYPKMDMCGFVQLAATVEHKALSTNKTNIAQERLLWYVYKQIATLNVANKSKIKKCVQIGQS
jgi:hypothetical protein